MVRPVLQRLAGPGRRAAWRRRLVRKAVSTTLAVVAVLLVLSLTGPSSAEQEVPVLVAARDLGAGAVAGPADVLLAPRRARDVPPAALRSAVEVVGHVLAGPVTSGEVLTSGRLVGASLLAKAPPGLVAIHLGATDPAALEMLRAGDRVDVYAAGERVPFARAALVLAKDTGAGHGVSALARESADSGLVAAVEDDEAVRIAAGQQAESGVGGFTFVLRPPEQ